MTPTGTLLRWGRRKGQRKDVSKEFPIYLDTTDESNSWLFQHNLHRCGDLSTCTALHEAADKVSGFVPLHAWLLWEFFFFFSPPASVRNLLR